MLYINIGVMDNMKEINYGIVLTIIVLLLIPSFATASYYKITGSNYFTLSLNNNPAKDIKITNIYLDGRRIVAEIQNNEETEVNIIVEFYEELYPAGEEPSESVSCREITISPGEIKQDYYYLPSHLSYSFNSIVMIGSEKDLWNKYNKRYDQNYDHFFNWYKFIGWEFDPSQEDIEVSLIVDREKYGRNVPVKVVISVTNHADEEVRLTFPSQHSWDFRIFKRDGINGVMVYNWSNGQDFLQIPLYITFGPGETKIFAEKTWDHFDNNGNKLLEGDFFIDGWMVAYYRGFNYHIGIHDISPTTISLPRIQEKPIIFSFQKVLSSFQLFLNFI